MKAKDRGIIVEPIPLEKLIETAIQQGRREVAEFVMGNEQDDGIDALYYFVIEKDTWEAKLREWGMGD